MTPIILIIFILCFVTQMTFWCFLFGKLAFYNSNIFSEPSNKSVSIVICAKNEAINLKNHLPILLNQYFPSYQVVVVNDHSKDESQFILSQLSKVHQNLVIVDLINPETNIPGKKRALQEGIQRAEHNIVLLTDADCAPNSELWIQKMIECIGNTNKIGLGYGPYKKKPGILNKWLRFETLMTAIQYFSLAICGRPYMGVGRNMIYYKSLFSKANLHNDIASGDDDFFIQSMENQKIGIQLDQDSFIYSEPPTSWKDYFRMKSRHITASLKYKWLFKFILGSFSASHILFWILFFIIIFQAPVLGAAILSVKLLTQAFIFRPIAKRFLEEDLTPYFVFFDFSLFLYFVMLGPTLFFRSKTTW